MKPGGFELKRPCLHCPFRTDATRIRFSGRQRAVQIEESAYRFGFPCHETAQYVEEDEEGFPDGGYYPSSDSSHCAGYLIMQIKSGEHSWPGIDNDEDVAEWLQAHLDLAAPVFDSVSAYLDANS